MLKGAPKELLLDQELIGFVKPVGGSEQTVWRASSAKVLKNGGHSGKSIEAFRRARTDADGES